MQGESTHGNHSQGPRIRGGNVNFKTYSGHNNIRGDFICSSWPGESNRDSNW